ncbi:hypothetical protein [Hyphomicrobium sp. CS1BSMeth3]|uniref:hypothetical protein n=1 Tax=Hyphomicrobium sp. CS1BSMeth3 TaxID=1892844 RepID=UPI000930A8A6|nr:hypothetical protein [Hyphomicrobium sp. CS1BSMeth3]
MMAAAQHIGAMEGLAARPVLHLSGAKLRLALEALIRAAEPIGGIERFAAAVKLKSDVLQDRLAGGKAAHIERDAFEDIVILMATVRRRIAGLIDAAGWARVRDAITVLLSDAHVPGTGDARVAAFVKTFPEDKTNRFVRDLASELLHGVYPEHYPLMHRWVWDTRTNTGVLREIWHDPATGDDVDHIVIDIPDGHETFLVLREELSQFLSDNGIFRDMLWYVDLLQAQIYGDYINAQGGAYLKTDFSAEADPLEHTRRILGLDRIAKRRGRGAIDGDALSLDAIKQLN